MYVFKRTGINWIQEGILHAAAPIFDWDQFGTQVAISGDYLMVGTEFHKIGGNNAGAAYLFNRDNTGTVPVWNQQVKFQAATQEPDNGLGSSIAMSVSLVTGNYFFVGQKNYDYVQGTQPNNYGRVNVFGPPTAAPTYACTSAPTNALTNAPTNAPVSGSVPPSNVPVSGSVLPSTERVIQGAVVYGALAGANIASMVATRSIYCYIVAALSHSSADCPSC